MKDIVIIGGGIAGLVNALLLARAGFDVLVLEKKHYPLHKVCGEYISNEVVPFLKSIGAYPVELNPSQINKLIITSEKTSFESALDLGGFGVSRYSFDYYLYKKAKEAGAEFLLNTEVTDIKKQEKYFSITNSSGSIIYTKLVIGAYGKRSKLDKQLGRSFFYERSPYIGVKYHIKTDFSPNSIALHIFNKGYCGISKIEDDKYCLCYLSSRDNLRDFKNIKGMEEQVLYKNPALKSVFINSEFLYDKPEVINEISFTPKPLIENGIFMCGDSAGMITPLCGNGMSIAIHSAKLLSELVINNYANKEFDYPKIEKLYSIEWNKFFKNRLAAGRFIQQLFLIQPLSDIGLIAIKQSVPLARWAIRKTHGESFY